MAKQTWNNPIDKSVDWGGDVTTGGLPVSGEQVQKFIKETFDKKAGVFYNDNTNNRYLVFADAEATQLLIKTVPLYGICKSLLVICHIRAL